LPFIIFTVFLCFLAQLLYVGSMNVETCMNRLWCTYHSVTVVAYVWNFREAFKSFTLLIIMHHHKCNHCFYICMKLCKSCVYFVWLCIIFDLKLKDLQCNGNCFPLFHANNFQVVEQGSHDELLALQGHYYSLVTADPTMTEGKHILLSVITRFHCFNVLCLMLCTNNFNSP